MTKSNKQINKESEVGDNDSSFAVVAYRTSQLEQTVKDGFREHNEKLDKLVQNYASKTDLQAVSLRITSLESDRKWLVRLVIGAVVASLLALIGIGLNLNP